MNHDQLECERVRFNALTPDEAKEILARAEGQQPELRSCWYCNGAHEHLKDRNVVLCFACGIYYLAGYPALVVACRAGGEDVSADEMVAFHLALSCDDD